MDHEPKIVPFRRPPRRARVVNPYSKQDVQAYCQEVLRELDELGAQLARRLRMEERRRAEVDQGGAPEHAEADPATAPVDGPTVVRCADRFRSE